MSEIRKYISNEIIPNQKLLVIIYFDNYMNVCNVTTFPKMKSSVSSNQITIGLITGIHITGTGYNDDN